AEEKRAIEMLDIAEAERGGKGLLFFWKNKAEERARARDAIFALDSLLSNTHFIYDAVDPLTRYPSFFRSWTRKLNASAIVAGRIVIDFSHLWDLSLPAVVAIAGILPCLKQQPTPANFQYFLYEHLRLNWIVFLDRLGCSIGLMEMGLYGEEVEALLLRIVEFS